MIWPCLSVRKSELSPLKLASCFLDFSNISANLSKILAGDMVSTRRSLRVQAVVSPKKEAPSVKLEEKVLSEPQIQQQAKRRKVIRVITAEKPELPLSRAATPAEVSLIVTPQKKKTKAAKKLLTTLHSEAELPSLQNKAKKVLRRLSLLLLLHC